MELNAARLADLVLIYMPVVTLVDLDASVGGFVVFAPALVGSVFEELIIAPRNCHLMVSYPASFQSLLRWGM